jgi:hypothetical protein
LLSNEYDVWITAKVDKPTVDLCAMADIATTSAVEALRRGPLARHKPFDPASLANADACALLDGAALARLPGVDATHPEIGFGNWDCRWHSTTEHTSLHVIFDHSPPLTAADGKPTRLSGRAAFVKADDDEKQSCTVKVVHRTYSDQTGHPAAEIVSVTVAGERPGKEFCAMTTELAKAAAAQLQR